MRNPFSPVFGGKPESFFGRKELLRRFGRALEVRGSDDRALFLTGTRGSGKTVLLEQFSQMASDQGWETIDVGAEHALQSLFRQLSGHDELTETLSPSVEVKVLGSGGSVSGKGRSKTTRYTSGDLDQLLIQACGRQKKGICVTIDEIQKVPLADTATLCEAFQMASRKGCDVVLVVAGLPYGYDEIIHQDGCTFMRRAAHEQINLLDETEVREAYIEAFRSIKGLTVTDGAFEQLVARSSGHPYMMQLLGYQLVEYLDARGLSIADEEAVAVTAPVALDSYEKRSLKPLMDELSEGERSYLQAMAAVADEQLVSATSGIAEVLGKTPQQVSSLRKTLIDKGVIVAAGHGIVRFNIPYLRAYVARPTEEEENLAQLDAWGV